MLDSIYSVQRFYLTLEAKKYSKTGIFAQKGVDTAINIVYNNKNTGETKCYLINL